MDSQGLGSVGVMNEKSYEELVKEALEWKFSGWDFTHLRGRLVEEPAPWHFSDIVRKLLPSAKSLLDMGTGGGELLSTLHPLPPDSYATEGYPPNVPIAGDRLRKLGVEVVQTYCDDNYVTPQRGGMPFRDSSIDLVVNRHESFKASEVFRILKPGGTFITQQVGSNLKRELNDFLGAPAQSNPEWDLKVASKQIENASFAIEEGQEAETKAVFMDIGAVVCYLRIAPWQIDDFDVLKYESKLRKLDGQIRESGQFMTMNRLFYIRAAKH